ncbi:MAG: hypothetical protein H0W86_09170 [Armatimonadetes bacterium]|nr:hypothetical protein [Armatimonadota bacterium]
MTIDEFLSKLDRVKKTGNGWTARCPAHDDRNPSLSVDEGQDGQVLAKCHAGCTFEQVLAAVKSPFSVPGTYSGKGNRTRDRYRLIDGWLRTTHTRPPTVSLPTTSCDMTRRGSEFAGRQRAEGGFTSSAALRPSFITFPKSSKLWPQVRRCTSQRARRTFTQ